VDELGLGRATQATVSEQTSSKLNPFAHERPCFTEHMCKEDYYLGTPKTQQLKISSPIRKWENDISGKKRYGWQTSP
jgi:hypothetical protein